LATSPTGAAAETRAFLDRALAHLPAATFARVQRRLQRADASGVDSTLHELVIFEICQELGVRPTFEPRAHNQTPDLSLTIGETPFWADVLVTYRPTSTLRVSEGLHGYEDGGEAARKIGDAIAAKAVKYRSLDGPLLVFVMFGRYDVDLDDLETGLYGSPVSEAAIEGVSPLSCDETWHRHGILCPPSSEAPHTNLSAVIACEWFDTLNVADRGRRLRCVAYHHWRPRRALPVGSFTPFSDLIWQTRGSDQRLLPDVMGESDIVMSTTSAEPPRVGRYSTAAPW
jgi:hypothetical protein